MDYQYLGKDLLEVIQNNPDYGKNNIGEQKKIVIEFSSPNTNKPLHLGHARNNSIGFSLSKILEFSNYQVCKVNLINDRGIHICQSMIAYDSFGKNQTPESKAQKSDHFVGDYYTLFHQKKKEEPDLEKEAQNTLQKWEKGDEKTRTLWKKINNWALDGIQKTYKRCGIEFDKFYFESETYELGKKEIEKAYQSKICYEKEDGAVAISLEKEKLGEKILLRKDKTAVYITQDISSTIAKYQDYKPHQMLFIVGSEQQLHFQILFAILKRFGYQWAENCKHLSYGMIFLPDGKMKSREGKIVDLDNLLNNIQKLAFIELEKRNNSDRSEEELLAVAEKIAQAAVKYFILRIHSKKDFVFDAKHSLDFEGNTGPYLQYTYARIYSLLEKVEEKKQRKKLERKLEFSRDTNFTKSSSFSKYSRKSIKRV